MGLGLGLDELQGTLPVITFLVDSFDALHIWCWNQDQGDASNLMEYMGSKFYLIRFYWTNHTRDSGTLLYKVIMMSPDQKCRCLPPCNELTSITNPISGVLVQVPHMWGGPYASEQAHREPILKINEAIRTLQLRTNKDNNSDISQSGISSANWLQILIQLMKICLKTHLQSVSHDILGWPKISGSV